MGISFRFYLFSEDGAIKRVPRRICEALPFGKDAIPEYAGTRQRVVQVLVENEDGRPVRILDATGHFWNFDDEGRIDRDLKDGLSDWMSVAFDRTMPSKGKVVDLVPQIKRKELFSRHRWLLSQEDMDRIAADIWPGITVRRRRSPPSKGLRRRSRLSPTKPSTLCNRSRRSSN